jgi:hypothetical protein
VASLVLEAGLGYVAPMRLAWVLLLVPLAARAEGPNLRGDVDFLLGTATTTESGYPFVPALGVFVGADVYDLITPGVRFLGVAGGRELGMTDGMRAFATGAEIRVHTPGDTQFWVSAGAGRGQLSQLQCDCDVQTFAGSRPGMSLTVGLGARRFVLGGLAGVGGEIGLTRWPHVTRVVELGPGGARAPTALRESELWAVTVGITVSGRTSP